MSDIVHRHHRASMSPSSSLFYTRNKLSWKKILLITLIVIALVLLFCKWKRDAMRRKQMRREIKHENEQDDGLVSIIYEGLMGSLKF
jgi:hypothetical protein